jgi:chemotaxis protein MotB
MVADNRTPPTESTNSAEYAYEAPVRKRAGKKDEGLWLMSFSDMSLILMSFFILQLSFSTIDKKKIEIVTEAVKGDKFDAKKDSLNAVNKRIANEIKRLKLDKSAQVTIDSMGVVVEFKDGLLFSVGSADNNPQFSSVVSQVMKVIASSPQIYQIKIEGHTDDVPMKSAKHESNWELSASRAISLMRQFESKGVTQNRMSIQAFAHTRPKIPTLGLVGVKLADARSANRRVVIRIETGQ